MAHSFSWKLQVEGLGKIRRASIQPRPLLLFVGDNNSGKSYLASLLWGFLSTDELWIPKGSSQAQDACIDWARRQLDSGRFPVVSRLDTASLGKWHQWLDELLQSNKGGFIQSVFNDGHTKLTSMHLEFPDPPHEIRIEEVSGHPSGLAVWGKAGGTDNSVSIKFDRQRATDKLPNEIAQVMLLALLSEPGAELLHSSLVDPTRVSFLPASRTGFMLTYKAIVKRQLRTLGNSRLDPVLELSAPVANFLERLAVGSIKGEGLFASEATFLEEATLRGRLALRTGPGVNEFFYQPREGIPVEELSLSMHLSSSVVTELAPLIYLLRYTQRLRFLILEEPEAHLHPRLQRAVAQVVARLIRKGVNVWITTHSENFCQQINNFINLGTHPERALLQRELGYSAEDYLDPDEVGAYQFKAVDGMSEVIPLQTTDVGIAMPSFNDELYALARESQRLSETRGDE